MKGLIETVFCLILVLFSICSHSQTLSTELTGDDLIDTWEWKNENSIFRVNLFEYSYEGKTSLGGHFSIFQIEANGEIILLRKSDRINEGTNKPWNPMIIGGEYIDHINSYDFTLRDNTSQSFLRGDLHLKFFNPSYRDSVIQISWKLVLDGIPTEGESFNVPTDLILTKVD